MLKVVQDAAEAVGGLSELASRLNVTRQAIHQWKKVPRGRVLEIEEITERKVTRHEMRPDIFGEAA